MSIESFYNMGSDLGYSLSGGAAEDIRLNREAKRQELQIAQTKNELAQQQLNIMQEEQQRLVRQENAKNAVVMGMMARNNADLMLPTADLMNQLNDEGGYFPGWKVYALTQEDISQDFEKLKDAALQANSVWGDKSVDLLKDDQAMRKAIDGLFKYVDTNTGEVKYGHVMDAVYMFGGKMGMAAYQHQIMQDQIKAQQEADAKRRELQLKELDTMNDIEKTNIEKQKFNYTQQQDARTQDNIAQVINSQGGLSNVKRMDKDSVTMHSPQNGTAQQLEQQLNNTNIEMDNLAKYIQIDKNTNSFVTETPTKQDFQNQIVKTMQSLPRDAKGNITDEAKATYKKSLEDYVYQLYEHEEAGIPGATERREALESALQSYDKSFGNGKVDDRGLDDLMAIGRSAIGSANNVRNGRGVTGILANLATEGQDLFNLRTESPNFQKKMQVLNSLNNDYMTYLNTLYTGRLNNKIIDQLKKGSDWRSFTRNATEFAWALGRMADKLEEKANSASPSKAGRAKYIAKKLRLASDTLNADITVYNDLHSNVADIQTSKTGPINAPYDKSTVYFDYKDSVVYLFAKGQPQAVASMSINEFKKYRDANIDNLGVTFNEGSNFLSTKLPSTWFKATKYDTAAGL